MSSIFSLLEIARNNNKQTKTLFLLPRSPIASAEAEMTLKQFGSITELLTKLRADLRQSFQR